METNRFKEGLAGLIAKEIKTQSAKFILFNRSKKCYMLAFLFVTHKFIQAFKLPRLLLIRLSPPTQLVAQHLHLPRNRIHIHHILNVREVVF